MYRIVEKDGTKYLEVVRRFPECTYPQLDCENQWEEEGLLFCRQDWTCFSCPGRKED